MFTRSIAEERGIVITGPIISQNNNNDKVYNSRESKHNLRNSITQPEKTSSNHIWYYGYYKDFDINE